MDFEQASVIGKRRRYDASLTLSIYVREKTTEVCAVKPAKGECIDARQWEPVGEENFKEIHVRTGVGWEKEAYLLVVDQDGVAKACTQKTYPLQIAVQMAWAIPLPTYAGEGGQLLAQAMEATERKAQQIAQLPDV